ncbi:MAG: serine/threonine protein kinase [Myxococcota bacterium]|nr:serine/threonine protein kinase [Myxococcota bacterium]
MADQRNPSGRRPPILPLPPPPEDDHRPPRTRQHRGAPPPQEVTSELPRLPEVELHDEASEVRVDHRALSRNVPVSHQHPHVTRVGRPTAIEKVTRGRTAVPAPAPAPRMPAPRTPAPAAVPMHEPQPPPRSAAAAMRVTTAQHSSLIGGRYQIVNRIGQGGMGKVYKVTHTHLSRTFALKIISNQVAETDEARELFYREARFASAMSHPSITAVVDFGEDEKVGMFMVMEMVDGEPLNRLLFREKRLGFRKACEIVLQVAEALHYIHRQNVVHCDIKTENILISEEEHEGKRTRMIAKLLDFGLARSLTATRASTSLSGTPHYVAPERIRGEPASPASDVYGVGILLYELVTGAVPWDGPVQKILAGHLDEIAKPPSQIIEGGIDPALERLIFHAIEKQPVNRHKDMGAFIYELRAVMDMLGFGRRAKGGATKRVVIEQRPAEGVNKRDELARIAFDGCRLPLALLTPQGVIVAANQAFAKFVMGVSVEVEGLPVRSTPLANAWSSCEQDLARTLAGSPVRRIIEIDVAGGEMRRLLLWLDAVSRDQIVLGVQPLEL